MSTLFISHSSQDGIAARELARRLGAPPQNHHSIFLDFDPEQGIVAGQSWERTLYRKLRSSRAVIALCTDSFLSSQWCFAEIALARMEGKHIIALQAEPLSSTAKMPSILSENQFIDLRQDPESGYQRLWTGLEELDLLGRAGDWDPREPPYLGLRAYQEKHAGVFFGRGAETRAGIELLERGAPDFILVLGSSGSGKSSLVRAGIVPRLRRDTDHWLVADPFRAERDPIVALAESLASAYRRYAPDDATRGGSRNRILERLEAGLIRVPSGDATDKVEGDRLPDPASAADERLRNLLTELEGLRRSPPEGAGPPVMRFLDWSLDDLRRICGVEPTGRAAARSTGVGSPLVEIADDLRRASGRPDARLLLIVDQFEEVLGRDGAEHRTHQFLKLLRDSLQIEKSLLMFLGTMRSDFLGLFQTNLMLRDVDFESLSVGPMSIDAMRRVIEEPAKLGAIELEQGLPDRLLEDTETADALPLLSFILWRLWRNREGGKFTVAQYEALGGLHGAVAREAEAVLELARKQGMEDGLRVAFLKMARITEDGGYARQPVSWDRAELQRVRPILEALESRRLLVTRQEQGQDASTLEVAHEALFRSWPPLKAWLDDHRSELLLQQQLQRDAQAWDGSARAAANLWRGGRLQQAVALLRSGEINSFDGSNELENRFVRAGVRRRRIRLLAGTGIVALFVAGLSIGLFATNRARNDAEAARIEAEDQAIQAAAARDEATEQAARADEARAEATEQAAQASALALAVQSRSLQQENPALSLALAAEAATATSAPSREARGALVDARISFGTRVAQPVGQPLTGHTGPVRGVAFSPDGARIVSASRDGAVRLWDVSSGEPVGEPLTGHVGAVWAVGFSPGGTVVASAGEDGAVRLWDVSSGEPVGEPLTGHVGAVWAVGFSPGGTVVASAGEDGAVWLWDVSSGEPVGEPLTGHVGPVRAVGFSPDGIRVASAGDDGAVRLWDVSSGEPVGEPLTGHTASIRGVVFSLDNTRIASGSRDGTVRLWDASSGEPVGQPFTGHVGSVFELAFSPDGTRIASAGGDDTVRLWDVSSGEPVGEPLTGHVGSVWGVAFSPDGIGVASAGEDGAVRLWDVSSGEPVGEPLTGHVGSVWGVGFSPDGTGVASAGEDGAVRLWDVSSGEPVGEPLTGHTGRVRAVAFSPDGTRLASASSDGAVRLWDVSSGEPVGEPLTGHTGRVRAVAFSPDGTRLASASRDGTVRLWDASSGESVGRPLAGHTDEVQGVAFSPDGIHIASASRDGAVRLWDVSSGEPVGEPLTGHTGEVWGVAFSPDGTRIASASRDSTVRLWDALGGEPVGEPLSGHTGPVAGVAFSPDGIHIASASRDGTVRLWDAASGEPVGEPLSGHTGVVWGVAFSRDGARMVSAGDDGTVRLWNGLLEPQAACALAERFITDAQLEPYLRTGTSSTCDGRG